MEIFFSGAKKGLPVPPGNLGGFVGRGKKKGGERPGKKKN